MTWKGICDCCPRRSLFLLKTFDGPWEVDHWHVIISLEYSCALSCLLHAQINARVVYAARSQDMSGLFVITRVWAKFCANSIFLGLQNVPKLVFMSTECSGYIYSTWFNRLPCLIMSLHSCLRLQDYVIFLRKNLKYTFSNLHLVAGHTDHHRFLRQELGVQLTQYRVGLRWEVKLYWFDWLIVLLNSTSLHLSLSLSLKMGTKSGAAISSTDSS